MDDTMKLWKLCPCGKMLYVTYGEKYIAADEKYDPNTKTPSCTVMNHPHKETKSARCACGRIHNFATFEIRP